MKVVLDTNVLLSALATRGLCEAVLEVCLANHEIVLSEYILKELRRNLKSRLRLPAAQVDEIVVFFERKQRWLIRPGCQPMLVEIKPIRPF